MLNSRRASLNGEMGAAGCVSGITSHSKRCEMRSIIFQSNHLLTFEMLRSHSKAETPRSRGAGGSCCSPEVIKLNCL